MMYYTQKLNTQWRNCSVLLTQDVRITPHFRFIKTKILLLIKILNIIKFIIYIYICVSLKKGRKFPKKI